jgi:hypothetical protein
MQKLRLLDEVRNVARLRHLSSRTEKAYVHDIRHFILFHDKRHLREVGAAFAARSISTDPAARHFPRQPL